MSAMGVGLGTGCRHVSWSVVSGHWSATAGNNVVLSEVAVGETCCVVGVNVLVLPFEAWATLTDSVWAGVV